MSKTTRAEWFTEVADAELHVRAQLPSFERDLVADVLVQPVEGYGHHPDVWPLWGACFYAERRIELYHQTFDDLCNPRWPGLPDLDRQALIENVLYHEFRHALGEDSPGHYPTHHRDEQSEAEARWISDDPLDVRVGDKVIHLP